MIWLPRAALTRTSFRFPYTFLHSLLLLLYSRFVLRNKTHLCLKNAPDHVNLKYFQAADPRFVSAKEVDHTSEAETTPESHF